MGTMTPVNDLANLCAAWKLPSLLSIRTPDTGTVHQTILLNTQNGDYALRAYRYIADDHRKIIAEHALIAFARACHLPVLIPLPLPSGETILRHKGYFYALFPFARGYQAIRGKLTPTEVSAMGASLGQLHYALHDYPHAQVSQRSFAVNEKRTLAKIDKIETLIQVLPEKEPQDLKALTRLAQQRAWLTTTPPISIEEFLQLEQQAIHGDYQETNLFFEGDRVSAIIDWDQAYVAPRAWEIVRTLHYALQMDATNCRLFLKSYRSMQPLTAAELEIAATAYGWKRAHDLWLYEELYLKGNRRVQTFLQSDERFIPFRDRWASLQPILSNDQ